MLIIESKRYMTPIKWDHYDLGTYFVYVVGFWNELIKDFVPSKDVKEIVFYEGVNWSKNKVISNRKINGAYYLLYTMYLRSYGLGLNNHKDFKFKC